MACDVVYSLSARYILIFNFNCATERPGWQVSAGRQLDDISEGSAQLFDEWRLPILLRRTSEHALRPSAWLGLRRLHDTGVSTAIVVNYDTGSSFRRLKGLRIPGL